MDRALQTKIVAKLFAHMAAGTTDVAPAEMYQPATAYTDKAQAAAEREALFKRLPLIACLSTELPGAYDFVTVDLAGVPALELGDP